MNTEYSPDKFAAILVQLAKIYDRTITTESVSDDFYADVDRIPLFLTMAQKAGFELKLVTYTLANLIEPLYPVILLLRDDIYILIEKNGTQYHLIDSHGKSRWVDQEILKDKYIQKAFLVKSKIKNKADQKYLQSPKHWFWDSLKFSHKLYIDVIVATFLLNIFALATPLFVRNVYDRVVPNLALDTLYILSSGIILVYIFDFVFRFLRTYFLEVAAKKSDVIMHSQLFARILNLKLSHKFNSVGAFANDIKEFDTLRNFFSSATLTVMIDLPFVFIFLLAIYALAGKIVLIPIIAGIVIMLYSFLLAKPLKKYIDKTARLASWKNGILVESLSALETIKSFGLHSMMQFRWGESVGEIANINMKSKILTASMMSLTNFIVQISNILVIIAGVYAIEERELTMGGLIAVTMLTSRALTPLVQIASLVINYEYAKSAFNLMNNIYKLPTENQNEEACTIDDNLKGAIEFRNVTFSYPGSDEMILDNVSFKIEPGESVVILGVNGSGKSTLLKLVMGFYEPTGGTILIDGIDIKQYNIAILRKYINYLSQDIILFNGSIRENIQYALPKASLEEISKSAELSGLSSFINSNPMGYDFSVGERGTLISGGQKQLIALTRFFMRRKSKIILLDEPTNGLDAQAENKILNALRSFYSNKTVLCVSHKRNIIELATRAIVLHNGNIICDGSKEQVLKYLEGNQNGGS